DRVTAAAADGWACWAYSNHDVERHASRWDLSPQALRLFTTLMTCLRGSLCLYQGEELGLPEADVPFEALQDPYGIEFWPEYKGRDGCRTPMVWEKSNHTGGFSSGTPWLPVPGEHLSRSAEAQEDDPTALIHHYRKALSFRRAHSALVKGDQSTMTAIDDVLGFTRTDERETVFCVFNLSDTPSIADLPSGKWISVGTELGSIAPGPDGRLHLGPWQAAIAVKANV
ncbi:MAG: alpha-amylase family glycosyl hydrolase, partial [Pseudomonadota bacterium]